MKKKDLRYTTQNPWKTHHGKELYDNPWINVTEYQVTNPSGGAGIYGVVSFKNLAIGVVPLHADGTITLVGQYRYPLERYSWEIPEGGGPVGVDPLESAQRELLEETGLKAHRWQELFRMHLSNSVSDELGIVFLAQEFEQHHPEPEETEDLELLRIPLQEAYQAVQDGLITDSLTVAAIFRMMVA